MPRIDTLIIGGGQAGLAMSHSLSARGIDHVVIERGQIAQAWRDRWDSLTLLTPNWMNQLPGLAYRGRDPHGFMGARAFAERLESYARSYAMPVHTETSVKSVRPLAGRFHVETSRGAWIADNVVVATGYCQHAKVPQFATRLDPDLVQLNPQLYRSPASVPAGGVLVVGASATGIQMAEELRRHGHDVTLAVGRHTRLPRSYRGRDILWWINATGKRSAPVGQGFDHSEPSPQLIGSEERRNLDLAVLAEQGVGLVGRVVGGRGSELSLATDVSAHIEQAEARLRRVLGRFDSFADAHSVRCQTPEPIAPVPMPRAPSQIDLRHAGIRTIFWATGYRRSYPWLEVPVVDQRGEIKQHGGVTPWPGLYVLGLEYMRRRNSATIDGVGADADALASGIARRVGQRLAA